MRIRQQNTSFSLLTYHRLQSPSCPHKSLTNPIFENFKIWKSKSVQQNKQMKLFPISSTLKSERTEGLCLPTGLQYKWLLLLYIHNLIVQGSIGRAPSSPTTFVPNVRWEQLIFGSTGAYQEYLTELLKQQQYIKIVYMHTAAIQAQEVKYIFGLMKLMHFLFP